MMSVLNASSLIFYTTGSPSTTILGTNGNLIITGSVLINGTIGNYMNVDGGGMGISGGLSASNIRGRTIASSAGMIGELLSYTLTSSTGMNNAADSYTNFPINIITPSVNKGIWMINVEGCGNITGGTGQYRIVMNDGTTDTVIYYQSFTGFTGYLSFNGSVIYGTTTTSNTFRLQGTGQSIVAQKGVIINAIRIA
jgi:hypothetical protein